MILPVRINDASCPLRDTSCRAKLPRRWCRRFASLALSHRGHPLLAIHAYIEVTGLALGIEFYCGRLGLTQKRQLSPRWVELAGANLSIFLLADRPLIAELGATKVPRDFERHGNPVHLDFIVSNLNEMVARLCRLGASLDREIQIREYGRMANMGDPFGNGFDLIEFSGPGYDNL
jgi:predicted enzyme related to lactoylglutathione lyase